MSQPNFSQLGLNPSLLQNLDDMGYATMTPIQEQSLPSVLAGKDVIAQGKTGSGKTAAFALGILNQLDVKRFYVQSLVLCPTRELADQVAKEIRKLARAIHNIKVLTLCGGMPFGPQIGSLEHGCHIVVGTPGRIEEHLRKETLQLDRLSTFVLDEADRMLEMGFQDAVDAIMDHTPKTRQTLLFSATFPDEIQKIAQRVMKDPVMVKVEGGHDNASIKQHFYKVKDNQQRLQAVKLLLLKHQPESSVVFCSTKRETQELCDELASVGFAAVALHGDLEQRDRDQTLIRFANKSASVLVATDVAARGLDVEDLDCVINYQIARDPEIHVHRIGRTGRAGSTGQAFTLHVDSESYKVAVLAEYLGIQIENDILPPFKLLDREPYKSKMVTLQIDGGKKQKVRPGDIVGALTSDNGIDFNQIGKIDMFDNWSFVAVARDSAKPALKKISEGKLKGRSFRVRRLRG
ncbi:MAG: ATP-independent RNA helicase DbpA [Oceanicoccus sp.]